MPREGISPVSDSEHHLPAQQAKSAAERLGQIELSQTHTSPAASIETDVGIKETESFVYLSGETTVTELVPNLGLEATEREQMEGRLEELGLEDIYFRTFSREPIASENFEDRNVYVLLHGWTADNRIYHQVPRENRLTVVEEILTRDPQAVIITPDGNGFGQTNFREDLSDEELHDKSTAEAYAAQTDFLTDDILSLGKNQVSILGHSLGGAATYELSRQGYRCVAAAPAAFATEESAREIATKHNAESLTQTLQKVKARLGERGLKIDISARAVYGALQISLGVGARLANLSAVGPLTDVIVEKVFETASPHLMGKLAEDPKTNNRILEDLREIHLTFPFQCPVKELINS